MKKLLPILIVGTVLAVVFRDRIPGLVSRAGDVAESVVGWTDQARKDDPVGYIEYAEGELTTNLDRFREARGKLDMAGELAAQKLEEYGGLHLASIELSEIVRETFQAAEGDTSGAGFPVMLQGKEYGREQLITQAQKILHERDLYADATSRFEGIIVDLEFEADNLETRIHTTEARLQELKVKKDIVAIQQITAEVDDLFAKIDELLGENRDAIEDINDPVRSVEELLQAAGSADQDADPTSDVMLFLEG